MYFSKIKFLKAGFIKLFIIVLTFWTGAVSAIDLDELAITNLKQPETKVFVSGQPEEAAFKDIATSGVQVIVNLRPESEQRFNEQAAVESAGMQYIHIPVSGASGITQENASKLQAALAAVEGKTVLVHCASGNRVGALRALIEAQSQPSNIDKAITKGKEWGLTGLETMVRDTLAR